MEPMEAAYLLEPASVTLIATAIFVIFGSGSWEGDGKEPRFFGGVNHVSQLITAANAVASASALYFCLFPYMAYIISQFGLNDPLVSRCCSESFTHTQAFLLLFCVGTVAAWLVTGHWILNNILGICICIAFVSHKASKPVHKVAASLSLPGLQLIMKKLELPVKLVFPRNLVGGQVIKDWWWRIHDAGTRDMLSPSQIISAQSRHRGVGYWAIPGLLWCSVLTTEGLEIWLFH